jgi:hypothetical protein
LKFQVLSRRSIRAEQSQFWRSVKFGVQSVKCKTYPIRPGLGTAKSRADKRGETNPISGEPGGSGPSIVQNEPNFRRGRVGRGPRGGGRGAIVQNEPNFRRGRVGRGPRGGGRGAIVQNEPNFRRGRAGRGPRGGGRGVIVQNEPNLRPSDRCEGVGIRPGMPAAPLPAVSLDGRGLDLVPSSVPNR